MLPEKIAERRLWRTKRVVIVEDNQDLCEFIKASLELAGHKVILVVNNLEDTLNISQTIREDREMNGLKIDDYVVSLDGNLGESKDCQDGKQIATGLKQELPGIPVVALSNSDKADYGDVKVDKCGEIVTRLPKVIGIL